MKIHENVHVKGIFHDDKSNRMKVYTRISGFSLLGGMWEESPPTSQWEESPPPPPPSPLQNNFQVITQ